MLTTKATVISFIFKTITVIFCLLRKCPKIMKKGDPFSRYCLLGHPLYFNLLQTLF